MSVNKSLNKNHFISGLVFVLFLTILGFVGWYNRWSIYDEYRLFNYHPPSQIASLASQDTMSSYAKKLFFAYHPQLDNASQFNQNCQVSEAAIVLGCTVLDHGIYLYTVNESQLNGVEQVTAAHEMLHVAYQQMSSKERNYIDGLVWSTYNNLKNSNPNLYQEEQTYLKTEGQGAVLNELHSVLGTEVAQLPPALEKYYSKFFTNRQSIVNFASQYQSVFKNQQTIVSNDDQQLASWKQQINVQQTEIQTQAQQLTQMQSQLNSLKAYRDYSAYNVLVTQYNSQVDSYNNLVNQTKGLIIQYNNLVQQRNSAATAANQLVQEISSTPLSTFQSN